MLKRMVIAVAFALIVGCLAPVGSARALTCCICTDCIANPEQARCFADLDETLCADFCAAQECKARELAERACFAPQCEGFPSLQSAPAFSSAGIVVIMLAAWLVGRRGLRRGKRTAA
jgi:hypothetical protein